MPTEELAYGKCRSLDADRIRACPGKPGLYGIYFLNLGKQEFLNTVFILSCREYRGTTEIFLFEDKILGNLF